MLTKQQNDLITLTGPGTPGGDLMRRYWNPVALAEELGADEPYAVKVFSEDLVLYRDAAGHPNLIGRYCPHRKVDLSYGRIEAGGLRCVYHGWVMAGDGRCLEQPGEPAGSSYKDRIRHPAYPCREVGGLIMAYLGPGEPPPLPSFGFFDCAPAQVWSTKILHACNYLQANEGNVDPQHLSFLHATLGNNTLNPEFNSLITADVAPKLEVQETGYGFRIFAVRKIAPDKNYVRITNFIMPNCSAFDGVPMDNPQKSPIMPNLGYQVHWHVPIDDRTHWKYTIIYRYEGAIDRDFMNNGLFREVVATHRSPRNAGNRYMQSRTEMKTTTFAGVGGNFYDQDLLVTETQGDIMDRSGEHLGSTDRPVMLMRKQMLQAIDDVQRGATPLLASSPEAINDMVVLTATVPASTDLFSGWWRQSGGSK